MCITLLNQIRQTILVLSNVYNVIEPDTTQTILVLSNAHSIMFSYLLLYMHCTAKPAHVVTSIKQSLVLKGHPFLVLSLEYFI